jgi:hypothetical protein
MALYGKRAKPRMCELFPLDMGTEGGTGTTQLLSAARTFLLLEVQNDAVFAEFFDKNGLPT